VALAARGSRNLDAGEERIEDEATRRELRRQARKVHMESALFAGLLTAVSVAAFP
jgi:hypothetical protein